MSKRNRLHREKRRLRESEERAGIELEARLTAPGARENIESDLQKMRPDLSRDVIEKVAETWHNFCIRWSKIRMHGRQ